MTGNEGKANGFRDEIYYIIPTELFEEYRNHPLVRAFYLTDTGFFPKAEDHYREREEGADQYILIYCTEGAGVIEVNGKEYELGPYEVFCIPRNLPHRYYADKHNPWSILWIHFKGENSQYFPLEELKKVRIDSKYSQNRMEMLFQILFRVLKRDYTLGNFIYLSQVLSLILAEIYFREKSIESSTQDRHVTTVIRYMYENLQKNLTLQQISEEVQLSKSYLNAIFRAQTGHSPLDFFIHLKMQEACKLLKSTDLYIYEVSAKLGYEDQYYFSRIFKKVVGVSPKDYRAGEFIYQMN